MPFCSKQRAIVLTVAFFTSLAFLLAVASSASALMLGMNWRGNYSKTDLEHSYQAGAAVYHMPINYSDTHGGNWGAVDGVVEAAWKRGLTILPLLIRTNGEGNRFLLPTDPDWGNWGTWAQEVVERYGVNGSFWNGKSFPTPVTAWEIWNEPNFVFNNPKLPAKTAKAECKALGQTYFENEGTCIQPKRYAEFLKYTAQKVQAGSYVKTAHGTNVLFGGLFTSAGENPETFLQKASNAGGLSGDVTGVAIHPYTFQYGKSMLESQVNGIRNKLNSLGASGKTLWLTEMGWPVGGSTGFPTGMQFQTPSAQAAILTEAFDWIKGAAAADKIELAAWFTIQDYNDGTNWAGTCGLLGPNGERRPAWYAFQKEAGLVAQPPVIGMVTKEGQFFTKEGDLGGEWLPTSVGISSISLARDVLHGTLVAEVAQNGDAYAKQGNLNGEWVKVSQGISSISVATDWAYGPVIAEVAQNGDAYVKQGSLGAEWLKVSEGIQQIAVASDERNGPLLAILTKSGDVYAKQGNLNGPWVKESSGIASIDVATDPVNGPLIAVLGKDSRFFVKQGNLEGPWVLESEGIKAISVATDKFNGPLISEVAEDGRVFVKQGDLEGGWTQLSEGIASVDVASDPVGGPVIGEMAQDGRFFVKQGSLEGGWIEESPAAQSIAVAP